jgi:hypothetical protein
VTDGLGVAMALSALHHGLAHTIQLGIPRAWVWATRTQPAVQVR